MTGGQALQKIMAVIEPMVPYVCVQNQKQKKISPLSRPEAHVEISQVTFLNSVVMPDPNFDSDSDGEEQEEAEEDEEDEEDGGH